MSEEQRLSKKAILYNPVYDSFFVGGSMSEMFVVREFNAAFNSHFAQMTLSGATSFEELNIIKCLPKSRYKFLVMELYFASHTDNTHATRYANYPAFLYDQTPFNDVQVYFLINRFMVRELWQAFFYNIFGIEKRGPAARPLFDGSFPWETNRTWNEEEVRKKIKTVQDYTTTEELKYSTTNFKEMMEVAAPKFEKLFLFFPPVNVASLNARFVGKHPKNLQNYLNWKADVIGIADQYKNVILIDYQTINRYTEDIHNYWDYNHFRSNLDDMILDDFESVEATGRLRHDHFGHLADEYYKHHLRLEY
jgi:hypothetical protein